MLGSLICSVEHAVYAATGSTDSVFKASNGYSQNTVTLAEVIHEGIDSIDWTRDDQWHGRVDMTHLGVIFDKLPLSAWETGIQTQIDNQNWVNALQGIRLAEIDGYTSPAIDGYTAEALSSHPMAGTLPANYHGSFLVYYRSEINGYRYAERLGLTDKWDRQQGYTGFSDVFANTSTFVWTCTSSGLVTGDDRHYDGAAETLGVFLEFYDAGVSDAMNDADETWMKLNNYSWPGYYPYHLGGSTIECEIAFSTIVGKYAEDRGGNIPFWDRVIQDIDYKLTANGWNSADWTPGGYTVSHANKNSERRLANTLNAFQVLHSFYSYFNDTMKNSFTELLTGPTPAWLGITQTDLCNPMNSYRFKPNSLNGWDDVTLIDTGTAVADFLLFLQGIVPVSGSLAIPKLDEVYEDVCSSFSAQQFEFDYDSRTIRIPVNAGEIRFQFGTTLVSYTFPTSGVYQVTFSDDWNTILSARGYGSVNVSGTRDGNPTEFEVWIDDGAHIVTGTSGHTFPYVTAGQHTVFGKDGWTLQAQPIDVQTSQITLVSFTFVNGPSDFTYSPMPAIENFTTTFDASNTTLVSGNISSYSWDFGDGDNVTKNDPTATHIYSLHGVYNVTLTVETSESLSNSTSSFIFVLRHDVSVAGLDLPGGVIYQSSVMKISVTLMNTGNFSETATVSIYYDIAAGKLIGTKTVTLSQNESDTLTFGWNATSVPCYQNYTLTAVSEIELDSNTSNNLFESSSNIQVRIAGDANGDGASNILDSVRVSNAFNARPEDPNWNIEADFNGDNVVDILDVILLANNFLHHDQ